MKRIAEFAVLVVLTAGICLSSSALAGEECASPTMSAAASAVASRYLQAVEKCYSFPSAGGRRDFVLVGSARRPPNVWRVLVVADGSKPRVLWDSFMLRDWYFDVIGLGGIDSWDEGDGIVVTLRGCAAHQCYDGKIGFALYSSKTNKLYVSHVTTRRDGSYEVAYYPKSDIPEDYRRELDQMMCSDSGISRLSMLPIESTADHRCPR